MELREIKRRPKVTDIIKMVKEKYKHKNLTQKEIQDLLLEKIIYLYSNKKDAIRLEKRDQKFE